MCYVFRIGILRSQYIYFEEDPDEDRVLQLVCDMFC